MVHAKCLELTQMHSIKKLRSIYRHDEGIRKVSHRKLIHKLRAYDFRCKFIMTGSAPF